MASAIVLIKLGKDGTKDFRQTVALIKEIRGVIWAYLTFGPTDVIAQVEADDLSGITDVVQQILSIPGVDDTDTRIITG